MSFFIPSVLNAISWHIFLVLKLFNLDFSITTLIGSMLVIDMSGFCTPLRLYPHSFYSMVWSMGNPVQSDVLKLSFQKTQFELRATLTCLIEAPVLLLGRLILMSPNSLNMAKIDLPNTSNVTRLYVLLKNKRYQLL